MANRLPPAWSKHLKAPAAPVAAHLPKAKQSPPAQTDDVLLRLAVERQQLKRFAEAQELCFQVLERTPNHPVALYVLGTLVLGFDDELALEYFARAINEKPDNPYFHLGLGEAYLMVGEHSSAIMHFQHALELRPDMVEVLCALGRAYVGFGTAELALPLYEKALGINSEYPKIHTGLAGAFTSLGRMEDAKVHLREAIGRRVAMPAAYNSLVNTRSYSEEPPELEAILKELDDPRLDPEGAENLHSAAGKVLNDLRRYEDAMNHFKKAKQAAGRSYDLGAYRRWVDATIRAFSPQMLASRVGYGNPSEAPVFVVGMPRSGTTLVEQICASHPDVHGAGELSKLRRAANGLGLTNTSAAELSRSVTSITADLCRTLADEHLSYLRERAPSALRIVDKMPHNFELIGLIGLLFPNARIIHCRRDAIDNCVSCFTQIFGRAHSYNADLRTLGLYYREYDRLMRHWEKVFAGRIFENHYEKLVEDQETQSRRLVDFLGLPWNDACLRFFEREGAVVTPSRWQVRQPIYKASVKRWKNYEDEIRPMIQALGDLADT